MADDLPTIARRLLAVRPEEFVAARTAASRDARADDRERATAIGALRKPAPAAWVVNLLAGQGALDDAVDLGPALRDAQAAADPALIRRLRTERRSLVESLVQAGADLAEEAGHAVTESVLEQVRATIEAAMADPWAGTAVRSGLLVRPLESVGFDRVDLEGAIAVPGAVDLPADEDEGDEDEDERTEAPEPTRRGGGRSAGARRASSPSRPNATRRQTAEQRPARQEQEAKEQREKEQREKERRAEEQRAEEQAAAERARTLDAAERAETDARERADAADAVVADLERQLQNATRAAAAAHTTLDDARAAHRALTDE